MSSIAAVLEFSTVKNCFLTLKYDRKKTERSRGAAKRLAVYEAVLDKETSVFFSLSSNIDELRSGDTLTLNGLYAEKLGIKDCQEVIMKPISGSPVTACRVNVEPLTVDDWEIMERCASQIENGLLDQIRVVWPAQVIPVWVEVSICIFIAIASVEPCSSFAILDTNTEVVVASKTRLQQDELISKQTSSKASRQQQQDLSGSTPPALNNLSPPLPIAKKKLPTNVQSAEMASHKLHRKMGQNRTKRKSSSDPSLAVDSSRMSINRRHTDTSGRSVWEIVSSFLGYPTDDNYFVAADSEEEASDVNLEEYPVSQDNLVYRIQPSHLSELFDKLGECGGDVDGDHCLPELLQQPTTIYVSLRDTLGHRLHGPGGRSVPMVYYAELRKLPSAQEREKMQTEGKQAKGREEASDTKQICCVVRVITVDRSAMSTSSVWQQLALTVLEEHQVADGHAVVPTELRRQLKLDVTGCAWVKTGGIYFKQLATVHLYPVSIVPRAVDNKTITERFKAWIKAVTDDEHPLVLFHGMLIRFPLITTVFLEVQLLLSSQESSPTLLSWKKLRQTTIIIHQKEEEPRPGLITPMLAYQRVDDFDPKLPAENLDLMGGVSGLTAAALRHLEACLGSRPLPRKLFGDRPGLNHGLLLLTGPKGSGKTCLARALCHSVSKAPTLAYTFIVDCKPLRGKRVENIQSLLERAFDEAAWRNPAVLLLDDLDVIAPASDNPATELSGEALYAAKVAQVLEGLVKFEMRNFTRLALIVTSQSRSSLHPSIVSSRGLHFVQEVTAIKPPDKTGRKELLRSILENHSTVLVGPTLENLDLDELASRTEGFVARDLQTLVNRALHLHLAQSAKAEIRRVKLQSGDFDAALQGYKPLAIRNVSLHTAGDLGWEDVGGLDEVKRSLVEILQWPSKYPQLFANCPLRLQSGLLLYGPPGTGKTLLAGAVARECNLNFISIKGPELLSKYIGASEQAVRDLFTRAQSAKPCILFFDEFDSIAPKRGHDSTGVTDRVVNQLLTQLDGVEGLQGVYMLGATSRPDLIDPALLRPGRLDKCLFCDIPTKEERRSILKALTPRMCLSDDVELDDIADMCEYFTGADFKALLYNAQLQAIHEYTDAERMLGDSVLRIKGSPSICSLVTKAPITISAKKSTPASATTSPTCTTQMTAVDVKMEDSKAVPAIHSPCSFQLSLDSENEPAEEKQLPDINKSMAPYTPPKYLHIGDGPHKKNTVTFFPKMGDAPAILTPEDEARFLNMVETIRRRQDQFSPRTNYDRRRRASSVLVKSSVLVPVGQRHLLAAAKSMRPSVPAAERLRYQVIYDSFVSGRQGDFYTGSQQTGMRTTLA